MGPSQLCRICVTVGVADVVTLEVYREACKVCCQHQLDKSWHVMQICCIDGMQMTITRELLSGHSHAAMLDSIHAVWWFDGDHTCIYDSVNLASQCWGSWCIHMYFQALIVNDDESVQDACWYCCMCNADYVACSSMHMWASCDQHLYQTASVCQ